MAFVDGKISALLEEELDTRALSPHDAAAAERIAHGR